MVIARAVALGLMGIGIPSAHLDAASPVPAMQPASASPADELRDVALGEVRDGAAQPWAGVEVVLVSRSIPADPDVGEEDRVVVVTGANGRFRASVLCGRPYSVWARGAGDMLGRRATDVAERVFAQMPVVLHETRRLQPRRLVVRGRQAWEHIEPMTVRVVDGTENRQVSWHALDADGSVTLPESVGAEVLLEVIGSDRKTLARESVALARAPAVLEVTLPPERQLHAPYAPRGRVWHGRVIGLDDAPLSGVEIVCGGRIAQAWRCVRTASATGEFTVEADGSEPEWMHVVLHERHYALLPPGWRRGLVPVVFAALVGQMGAGSAESPVVIDLANMCPIELNVGDPTGAPASGVEIGLDVFADFEHMPAWGWGADLLADARGRLRILVPAQEKLGMRAVKGLSMRIRAFATPRGRPDHGPAAVRFVLPEPVGILGRVVDRAGTPVTTGYVMPMFGTSNTPAAWAYEKEVADVEPGAYALRVFEPREDKDRLWLTRLVSRRTLLDGEGKFAVPMPPEAMPDLLLYHFGNGAERVHLEWTGTTLEDVLLQWIR